MILNLITLAMVYNINKKMKQPSQEEKIRQMNAYADRAVSDTIRTLYAQIGVDKLEKMIAEAKNSGDRYTTLADLVFKAHEETFPEWRKER